MKRNLAPAVDFERCLARVWPKRARTTGCARTGSGVVVTAIPQRILLLKTAWNARDWSVIGEILHVLQSLVERDVPTGA